MRALLLGMGILAAALTVANVQPAEAADRPYCLSGNRANGGMPDCSYHTWAQCRAAVSGSDHCYANPALMWGPRQGSRPPRLQSYTYGY